MLFMHACSLALGWESFKHLQVVGFLVLLAGGCGGAAGVLYGDALDFSRLYYSSLGEFELQDSPSLKDKNGV